jgi:hypothetical protein
MGVLGARLARASADYGSAALLVELSQRLETALTTNQGRLTFCPEILRHNLGIVTFCDLPTGICEQKFIRIAPFLIRSVKPESLASAHRGRARPSRPFRPS